MPENAFNKSLPVDGPTLASIRATGRGDVLGEFDNGQENYVLGTSNANGSTIPQRLLGHFSLSLLASIQRLGDRAWGANLQRDLSEQLGRDVAIGQLYVTLARLTDHKLIYSEQMNPEPVKGGRAKKLFKLNALGAQVLGNAVATLAA